MSRDTSPDAMARYIELLRAMSPADRLRAAVGLTATVRRLAEVGIRDAHPEASDEEVRVRLAVRLYGREVAKRLFGHTPEDAR